MKDFSSLPSSQKQLTSLYLISPTDVVVIWCNLDVPGTGLSLRDAKNLQFFSMLYLHTSYREILVFDSLTLKQFMNVAVLVMSFPCKTKLFAAHFKTAPTPSGAPFP